MSGRSGGAELKIGGAPRVQLLPSRVKEGERARSSRRFMVFLVVVALAVVGGGVAWAYLAQVNAQRALDDANLMTQEILAQQVQYAEAAQLADLVALTEQAQQDVTATEIQWLPLAIAIRSYIPADVIGVGWAMRAPAPWEAELSPEGVLRVPRVAVVELTLVSPSYASAAAFVERIPELYGFADVFIDSTDLENGQYSTHVTLTLDADAVSRRFAPDAASDSGAAEPAPDGTPSPTPTAGEEVSP